jgi:phytol kinase
MNPAFIATVAAVLIILVGSELWWRNRNLRNEFSRKFVHITVGSFVAFWPFFLSWNQIRVLSVAFLIVVAISKYLQIFTAIHSVQRPTWGELFFAAAVGIITLVTHDKWIYMAALLQMGLADGLAAVIGTHFGKPQRYLVWGHAKSVVGTITFFVVSMIILLIYYHHTHDMLTFKVPAIAALSTVIENIGVNGFDNLLVPLLTAWMLTV